MKFTELNLDQGLLDGIDSLRFEDLSPIQEMAIPPALEGKDLIACAQTGTGKTAAYLIPTIQRLMKNEPEGDYARVLIIAPTRELARQIDQNVEALSYFTGVSSVPIIGGKDADNFTRQKYGIVNGADILIATPGRLIIHMALGYLDMSHIEVVILDEADKMLDMGFHGDIVRILSDISKDRQTLMFSATMPNKIRDLAREIMRDPMDINLNISTPAEGINQMAFLVYDEQKIPLLEHLIREREIESMIIFASSKVSVDRIAAKLEKLKYNVRAMHSDKEQEERQITLREFKNKQFPILVGTDVLSRGIDIDNLSHVLNYDAPRDAEDYVHRVGRTARASSTGEAITFFNPKDIRKLHGIERLIGYPIPKPPVPEELGETPSLRPDRRRKGKEGNQDRFKGRNRGGGKKRNPRNKRNERPRNHNGAKGPGTQDSQKSPRKQDQGPVNTESSPAKKRRKRRRPPRKRPNEGGNIEAKKE